MIYGDASRSIWPLGGASELQVRETMDALARATVGGRAIQTSATSTRLPSNYGSRMFSRSDCSS
jgi:hypothetical protein